MVTVDPRIRTHLVVLLAAASHTRDGSDRHAYFFQVVEVPFRFVKKRTTMPRNDGLKIDRDVILFFADRDPDTFVRGDRHLRRRIRKFVANFRPHQQRVSGFEVSFQLLCRALREAGRTVHVDDYRLARRNPDYPVGLCGYKYILDGWNLPNPAVLGPGLYDHPKQAPQLLQDLRFRSFLTLCDWMRDMFAGLYSRDKLDLWFGGIDLAEWPDSRFETKTIDVLVYDKIRWNRDSLEPTLLEPIVALLEKRGLSYEVIRYGRYTHDDYRNALRKGRSMVFLCEHETQGMAYQEALASNVPVIAWDQGTWLDPNRPLWEAEPVPASSVPYFSITCGERFRDMSDFAETFNRFWNRLNRYEPRKYVASELSFEASAAMYLKAYERAGSSIVR